MWPVHIRRFLSLLLAGAFLKRRDLAECPECQGELGGRICKHKLFILGEGEGTEKERERGRTERSWMTSFQYL